MIPYPSDRHYQPDPHSYSRPYTETAFAPTFITRSPGIGMPDPSLPPLTLKRPRSTSNPPSPTGSSSSKKAASEDTVSSPALGSDGGRLDMHPPPSSSTSQQSHHLLSASMVSTGPGSSPLRVDVDGGDDASTGWVKRTEEVHLGEKNPSSQAGLSKEKYEELYNILLCTSSLEPLLRRMLMRQLSRRHHSTLSNVTVSTL